MRIGVLRGRENSFPEAFVAKVNSMGKGVEAEFVQLGGTKLNEPVPYRVILDRMSHEVPYYAVYLKMAALQGCYCINNIGLLLEGEINRTSHQLAWPRGSGLYLRAMVQTLMRRLPAAHRWPASMNADAVACSAAVASVASSQTTSGFLPPSSRQAACPWRPVSSPIFEPTAEEPVKPTLSTRPSSSARVRPSKAVGPSL